MYALLHGIVRLPLFVFDDALFTLFVVLNTVVLSLQSFFYAVLRWMGKSHIASVGNILVPVTGIIPSAAYFFAVSAPSFNAFLCINFLGGLAGLLGFLFLLHRKGLFSRLPFSVASYKEMFRFSFPLGINSLLFNAVRYSDRFVLAFIFGNATLLSPAFTDYLLIQRICQFMASVLQLVSAAFLPIVYEQSATEEGRKKIRSLQHLLIGSHIPMLVIATIAVAVWQQSLFATDVLVFYFPFSLIAFFALSDLSGVGLGFVKGNKTREILSISLVYLVVNTLLQVLIGRWLGLGAVLVSNCLVAIAYSFVYLHRSEKHFRIGYNQKLVGSLYLFMVVASFVFLSVRF